MKMLFDPFEEEFDLPSLTIKFCDCQSWQVEVIGHKSVNDTCTIVFKILSGGIPFGCL